MTLIKQPLVVSFKGTLGSFQDPGGFDCDSIEVGFVAVDPSAKSE